MRSVRMPRLARDLLGSGWIALASRSNDLHTLGLEARQDPLEGGSESAEVHAAEDRVGRRDHRGAESAPVHAHAVNRVERDHEWYRIARASKHGVKEHPKWVMSVKNQFLGAYLDYAERPPEHVSGPVCLWASEQRPIAGDARHAIRRNNLLCHQTCFGMTRRQVKGLPHGPVFANDPRAESAWRGTYFGQIILSVACVRGIVIRSPDAHLKRRPSRPSSSLTMLTGLHVSGHHW